MPRANSQAPTSNDATRVWLAMTIAVSVIASFVAGKAARDAIFLSSFDVTMLPALSGISAALSLPLVIYAGRLMAKIGPARLVPALNVISAALLVIEWSLLEQAPRAAALMCFLHLGSLGAVLVSGFWSVISERFDARTAKRYISRIGLGGTLGGIVGGLVAERTAVITTADRLLLIVAGIQVFVAIATWRLAARLEPPQESAEPKVAWSSLRQVSSSPLLRTLAVVLVFGAVAAAALDYVFKAEVARDADDLLRVLAVYHTVVNVATALLHVTLSRMLVTRLGVARGIALLPTMTTLASAFGFLVPGMWSAMVARGVEMVTRSSIFRAAYELVYAPLAEHQKRASKVVLDVGAERIGDLLGALAISAVIFSVAEPRGVLLACAALAGALALVFAARLPGRYSDALAASLVDRGADRTPPQPRSTLAETGDLTMMSLVDMRASALQATIERPAAASSESRPISDPLAGAVAELRSGDASRVRGALAARPDAPLAPFIIPLLGQDELAARASRSLVALAPKCTGALVDALLDSTQDFAVRRRIPAILTSGQPALARWGLLHALADPRFEVRYRCARALSRMPTSVEAPVEREVILDLVRNELAVDSAAWKSYHLVDDDDDGDDGDGADDASASLHHILRLRSELGLEHVFALLGLVFPMQPLQIALQSLYTGDRGLHATALEYLESILPHDLRALLWPLVEGQSVVAASRPMRDVAEALRMSQPLIASKLQERASRK